MVKGYENPKQRRGVFDLVRERTYSADKHSDGNIATLKEGDVASVITSPPYSDQSIVSFTDDKERTKEIQRQLRVNGYIEWQGKRYTEDEWRAMNHGRIDGRTTRGAKKGNVGYSAVISSPPYSEIATGAGGLNTKPPKDGKGQSGRNPKAASQDTDQKYGINDGQIARLKEGRVDGVLTSPPYEEGLGHGGTPTEIDKKKFATSRAENKLLGAYKDDRKSIGREKNETYWVAMSQVYVECFKILKEGGVIAIVVKDFVRNKARVPLCDNTVKLLEHIGFTMEYRVRASVVEPGHDDMFTGQHKRVERKSFFRRLAEQKGSPKIDWEEVLIARKVV